MRKLYFLLGLALVFSLPVFAQLDITFNGTGRTSAAIGSTSNGRTMLIQPADNYVVVAGDCILGTTSGVGLVRFTKDGVLDPNFGSGGRVVLPFNRAADKISIGIQSNGSIIVCFNIALGNELEPSVLVRVTNTGQIDYGFSSTGFIQLNLTTVNAILIQADDKIVVGCDDWEIARFSKDGVADPTFGTAGVFELPGAFGYVQAMAFQTDGSIFATGRGETNVQTIHLSTKGVWDTKFGTKGISTLAVNNTDPVTIAGITVIPGGNILLTGSYFPAIANPNWHYLLAELHGDGTYNVAFAGNGKLSIPFANYNAYGQAAVQLQEGQIVMAGYVTPANGGADQVGLCRVTANGAIDNTFGPGGTEITGWTSSKTSVEAYSIALQAGKIVVGGNLGSAGYMAMRYLNPIILPPPPIVDATTSIVQNNTLSPTNLPLRLYPNPATQTLNVQGLDPAVTTLLQVVDAAGHAMLTSRASNQPTYALDITQLPSGNYFLTLSTQTARKTVSFVKTR